MMLFSNFPLAALAAGFFLFSSVFARNISEVSLTECGINCYETICNSTTDLGCACSDTGFDNISQCLYGTCGVASNYYVSYRVLFRDCGAPRPVWTVDPDYWTAAIIVFVIQSLFFGLRITARVMKLGTWGWDDAACAAAYVTLVGQLIMCILLGHKGDYINYWTLDFDNLPPFWRINFARAVLYAIGLGLSKASIVFLYQRIFEGPRLRWVLLATQVFNALLALSYIVTAFFTARPFGCSFVLDEPAGGCTYNDVWDGSGAYSAVNAAYDAWLVGIPAVVVWRLQMRTANKVGVIAVFAAGVLTCLVAIARAVIYSLNGNPDLSDYNYQLLIWVAYYASYAELTSCFVITCLPTVRQLFGKKVWPALKTGFSSLSSTWSSRTRGGSSSYSGAEKSTRSKSRRRWTISDPLSGSFQHLTSHLQAEDPRFFTPVGSAI